MEILNFIRKFITNKKCKEEVLTEAFITDKTEIEKYLNILINKATNITNLNKQIVFDCKNIVDQESFWDEVQNKFTYDCDWFGRNFDALFDAFSGNCGLFEEIEIVEVSIINVKSIDNNTPIMPLFIKMLTVLTNFVTEIKYDDYSNKYIELLQKELNSIYVDGCKSILLRLCSEDNK